MITLAGVKDWVKSLGIGEHFSVGRINTNLDKSLGIYQRDARTPYTIPVGGLANKSYDTKNVTILMHWTDNASESERAALELFEAIQSQDNVVIDNKHVKFIRLVTDPIDVTDPQMGVYEYVIQLDFITER